NTKLIIPPAHSGLIFRSRLIDYLQSGFKQGVRLILISAPAGSGKSTLVSEWISSLQSNSISPSVVPVPRFAWLSLDPGDNEPLRFWIHLIGALQVSLSDFGHSQEKMLSLSELPSFESILTSLINQLGSRSERIVL